ncbi:ribosomal protein S10, partial [Calocera viscosa TUFC12733]
MGTPHPIPRIDHYSGTRNEEGGLAEPIFQPPPRLDTPSRGYLEPQPLPKTHGVPVAILHLRSYHVRLLRLFIHFAQHSAVSLGIPSSGVRPLPTQRRLWTVIKGPFVHKKAQENFVRLTHKRAITLFDTNPQVLEMYFSYLQAHALAGVGMRTVRWDR